MSNITNIVKGRIGTSANIDGIQFNSIEFSGSNNELYHTIKNNTWQTSAENAPNIKYAVNGVDINWNGAVLPNADITNGGSVTINTTGELLNLINEMQKEIYTLAAAVIAIGNNQ